MVQSWNNFPLRGEKFEEPNPTILTTFWGVQSAPESKQMGRVSNISSDGNECTKRWQEYIYNRRYGKCDMMVREERYVNIWNPTRITLHKSPPIGCSHGPSIRLPRAGSIIRLIGKLARGSHKSGSHPSPVLWMISMIRDGSADHPHLACKVSLAPLNHKRGSPKFSTLLTVYVPPFDGQVVTVRQQ